MVTNAATANADSLRAHCLKALRSLAALLFGNAKVNFQNAFVLRSSSYPQIIVAQWVQAYGISIPCPPES